MPPPSPVDRLAHELAYPEQDTKSHRAVTAADLQHLLDPDYEPFAKTTKVPPLPAYGPDPYNGSRAGRARQPQSYTPHPPDAAGANASSTSDDQPAQRRTRIQSNQADSLVADGEPAALSSAERDSA